jgi:hypothetical protein
LIAALGAAAPPERARKVEHPFTRVIPDAIPGRESRSLPQMRYVIGLSIVLAALTWRSGDVQHATDLLVQALAQLIR